MIVVGLAMALAAGAAEIPEVRLDEAITQLSPRYTFSLDTAFAHLPAELILTPDRQPVRLIASVKPVGALSAGLEERSRTIHWETDGGKIIPSAEGAEATLVLPGGSRRITVRATLQVRLARGTGAARTERQTATLDLLCPAPASMLVDGVIDGYRIGHYLDPADPATYRRFRVKTTWPRKYPEKYRVPDFFYRCTPETKRMKIAPHQTLGFWMTDFPWKSLGKTQYIALDPNLAAKLEDLLELLRARGVQVTQFVPIYGFRPPSFNLGTIKSQSATNLKEPFSMHQYGRAVDLIIDEDGDGVLDDLNHDGKITIRDAALIRRYVDQLDRRYLSEGRMEMVGGAGIYDRHDFVQRPIQTPYIHIDTRGFLDRNGSLVRW